MVVAVYTMCQNISHHIRHSFEILFTSPGPPLYVQRRLFDFRLSYLL